MDSLFIGHTYIDVTIVADHIPTGDEKAVADDYAFGLGGNAVIAAFTNAILGHQTDLLTSVAKDSLSDYTLAVCEKHPVTLHPRQVGRTALSLVIPNNGQRSILRCRDTHYLDAIPQLDITGLRALHLDGHQMDAAIHYARLCRQKGIMTSLDGGSRRQDIEHLLDYIDVAVVSERFCEQFSLSPRQMVDWLSEKGVKVPAVTLGDKGLVFVEDGQFQQMSAIPLEKGKVVDSTGAGDIFHGAYVFSYLRKPEAKFAEHFKFARAASALAVQRLGTMASIPALDEVEALAALHP
ncbi:MAG: sugar kinase [Proteobacteria bacterium]|nr:sugar kinase [Pseudomonadota bacterium]